MHGFLFVIFLAVALFFGVIWFVASIIKATKRAIYKPMFKREAKIVSNMIIGLSDNLDRMFLPCNFISIEEINKFRNDNKDAIEAVTEEMTAQDVEKLREERRNRGKLRSFPNPLLSRNYPQFTEGVSEEGSPDDLPF